MNPSTPWHLARSGTGFAIVWICGAVAQAVGPPTAARDISPIIRPILERHKVPGMVAAVVEGDRVIALAAAGVRRHGAAATVTIDDRFHLGSCTKSMTATLCAMLVEEGKLSWTSTLAEVFPDLAGKMHPRYRSVTLEQLLTNRGGVPTDLRFDGLWARLWKHRGTPTQARRLLLEGVVTHPPDGRPGTDYVYSNGGFSIAGHMAERVTGRSWEDLMREMLFKPLGMASAGFGAPGRPGTAEQPLGHTAAGEPVEPGPWGRGDNPIGIAPANAVHCTIGDWGRYVILHLRGAQGDATFASGLLKPETFAKLHTSPGRTAGGPLTGGTSVTGGLGSDYSMGWVATKRPWASGAAGENTVLTHEGSNTMWLAVTWIAPGKDFAVLVACNQGGKTASKACDQAAWALIRDHLKSTEGAGPE